MLSAFVRTEPKRLRAYDRYVRVHDISTNRDIIVSVDRFFELFYKDKKNVQIGDLILVDCEGANPPGKLGIVIAAGSPSR